MSVSIQSRCAPVGVQMYIMTAIDHAAYKVSVKANISEINMKVWAFETHEKFGHERLGRTPLMLLTCDHDFIHTEQH